MIRAACLISYRNSLIYDRAGAKIYLQRELACNFSFCIFPLFSFPIADARSEKKKGRKANCSEEGGIFSFRGDETAAVQKEEAGTRDRHGNIFSVVDSDFQKRRALFSLSNGTWKGETSGCIFRPSLIACGCAPRGFGRLLRGGKNVARPARPGKY